MIPSIRCIDILTRNMTEILLDFDGTIIDFWARYHTIFCKLTGCDVTLDEYKMLKRKFKTDIKLAEEFNIVLPIDYRKRKLKLLEDDTYLDMDSLLLPKSKLIQYVKKNEVIILSCRNNENALKREFIHLGLGVLISKITCINSSKIDWVRNNVKGEAIIIGDDVRDLRVASLPNVKAVMVLTGIGTKQAFDEENIQYELSTALEKYIGK